MRIWFLLLFCLPALAEPEVRWIDVTGGAQRRAIKAVTRESGGEIEVVQTDGGVLKIPMRNLLTLVREDESDPQQRALLEARGSLYLGSADPAIGATLDKLVREGREDWIKEYAAAHRALFAQQSGADDAETRIAAFLEAHPDSRFRSRLWMAQGRIRAKKILKATEDQFKAHREMEVAQEQIFEAKGPLVLGLQCLVDGGDFLEWEDDDEFMGKLPRIRDIFHAKAPGDAAQAIVVECAVHSIYLRYWTRYLKLSAKRNVKPLGALDQVEKLDRISKYLLPELRSDVAFVHGRLLEACGRPDEAKKAYARSLKLAPDPWRRARARQR